MIKGDLIVLWTYYVYVYNQTKLLTSGGQQRAKTDPAQCVLQLVPVTVYTPVSASLPSSLPSSVQPGAVKKNMHIVAKVQGFLPPTHTRHWLPLYPAPWEENTLGMNCAWLPTGWMLPLCAVRGGPGGCGWLSSPYLAIVTFVIFWKKFPIQSTIAGFI